MRCGQDVRRLQRMYIKGQIQSPNSHQFVYLSPLTSYLTVDIVFEHASAPILLLIPVLPILLRNHEACSCWYNQPPAYIVYRGTRKWRHCSFCAHTPKGTCSAGWTWLRQICHVLWKSSWCMQQCLLQYHINYNQLWLYVGNFQLAKISCISVISVIHPSKNENLHACNRPVSHALPFETDRTPSRSCSQSKRKERGPIPSIRCVLLCSLLYSFLFIKSNLNASHTSRWILARRRHGPDRAASLYPGPLAPLFSIRPSRHSVILTAVRNFNAHS